MITKWRACRTPLALQGPSANGGGVCSRPFLPRAQGRVGALRDLRKCLPLRGRPGSPAEFWNKDPAFEGKGSSLSAWAGAVPRPGRECPAVTVDPSTPQVLAGLEVPMPSLHVLRRCSAGRSRAPHARRWPLTALPVCRRDGSIGDRGCPLGGSWAATGAPGSGQALPACHAAL